MLEIIYQDEYYIAINKPSGLLVHRSNIDKYETRFAIQMLRDQIGQRVYPVHRIDKPTSGILLFGLDKEAAAIMHQQFIDRRVCKSYLAIVRGFTPDNLAIDHPVKSITDKYEKPGSATKEAFTQLKTLAKKEFDFCVDSKYPASRYSLVKLHPRTGRRHQLRYHMKHIAHPIIGDAKYGKGIHNRYFKEKFQCNRLLLAATGLSFYHPYSAESVTISAMPTDDFCNIVDHLGWHTSLTHEVLQ